MLAAFLLFGAMYIGREILVPLVFAMLVAMLLMPLCTWFEARMPRWLAVGICVAIFVTGLLALAAGFSFQVVRIAEDLPRHKDAIYKKVDQLQRYVTRQTDLSKEEQEKLVREKVNNFVDKGGAYVQEFISSATGLLGDLVMVIIYTFLFLYSRDRFRNFVVRVTPEEKAPKVKMIIARSSKITGRYLSGVLIVMSILAVIYSVGLMIVGLDYPVFFGVMVAVFNIIPYVGIPVASILPVAMAIVTKDSYAAALAVCGVFALGQFIDNNFLTPNIVGDKVNLNALTTIVALLVGASVWGIAGMILFIPLLGVIRIILNNSNGLKPYAYLLSSNDHESVAGESWFKKIYNKIRSRLGKQKKG
jgi:predicted PurR-regulated permease PerM